MTLYHIYNYCDHILIFMRRLKGFVSESCYYSERQLIDNPFDFNNIDEAYQNNNNIRTDGIIE